MQKFFLASLLLTVALIAGEPANSLDTTKSTLATTQDSTPRLASAQEATPAYTSAQADSIILEIKNNAAKLSFFGEVNKSLDEPISAQDIQKSLAEKGIDVPLSAIKLSEPIVTPNKNDIESLKKVTIDLGNGHATEVFIDARENKEVNGWEMGFIIFGGLAIFLLGMNYMSTGLQTIAGPRMRKMISAVTTNRFTGVLAGTGVTTIIQSSSVTTVMVVGFVNSGIMTLKQALGVIFGANIGTTITGWIIALSISKYGLPMLAAGALVYLFSRKDNLKYLAMSIMGLGMIFYGLEMMKDGFAPIKSIPAFEAMFHAFQVTHLSFFDLNVYKAVLVGAGLTMIVQSSSATLGITITLAATGVINFYTAAALVLGENIGTTITAVLASLNANKTAKRAAYGHVLFNVLGVVWITTIFPLYIGVIETFFTNISQHKGVSPIEAEIALVHTGFNLLNVIVFLPFINYLARLLEWLVPVEKDEATLHLTALHQGTMFDSPALAIEAAKFEIEQMGKLVITMGETTQAVLSALPNKIAKEAKSTIFALEEDLDVYQKEVSNFLMDLSANGTNSHAEAERVQMLFRHADEYESISDYYANVLKKCLKIEESDIAFPAQEKQDLCETNELMNAFVLRAAEAICAKDGSKRDALVREAQEVKFFVKAKRKEHLMRLQNNVLPTIFTVTYLDILTSYRQMNEHLLNMCELL